MRLTNTITASRNCRATVLALGIAALMLTGCSTNHDGDLHGEARAAAEAVHEFHKHLVRGESLEACSMLTGPALQEYSQPLGDCVLTASALHDALTPTERQFLPRLRIRRVHVRGDRAMITDADVVFPRKIRHMRTSDQSRPTVLVRRDGKWLLERLG